MKVKTLLVSTLSLGLSAFVMADETTLPTNSTLKITGEVTLPTCVAVTGTDALVLKPLATSEFKGINDVQDGGTLTVSFTQTNARAGTPSCPALAVTDAKELAPKIVFIDNAKAIDATGNFIKSSDTLAIQLFNGDKVVNLKDDETGHASQPKYEDGQMLFDVKYLALAEQVKVQKVDLSLGLSVEYR